jgi:hypothetical protein
LEVVDTKNRDEGLFSFIEYLDLIRSKAKGFTYKIAILHRAQEIGTNSFDVIENRVHCVTFLSANGWEDPIWNKKLIMGKVLNQLITHKNKTKKYVYDKTALQSSLLDENLQEGKFQFETSMM